MTWFEMIKQVVRLPEAATYYGLQVSRNGMVCCPFHDDRYPSMKLNERYFYCLGYGATGDVIDLVAISLPRPKRPLLKAYGSKYKDFYYYGCKHCSMTCGHKCDYKK